MFLLRFKKLLRIITVPSFVSALVKGAAAGTEHLAVLRNLRCEFIVDVGANRGQFALAARRMFPKARIHSFEPLQEPAQIFKNVFARDTDTTLYPYALGRENTIAVIHVTKDDDASSMLPVTPRMSGMFPGAAEKETRQVPVCPLSEWIKPASIPSDSLLKIDVQGFELDVLQGCEDVLDRFKHLYVECSYIEMYEGQALAPRVIAWLEEKGFALSGVHNLYHGEDGTAIQGDFLFTRRKLPG
jgi:FkbM family methyltransferase